MKKANFNTLKNLSVPESWIENALMIPQAEEQRRTVVPLWKNTRFVAMAASLAMVSALSLALFLGFGSKSPLPVKPSSTEIVRSTDENGEVVATEVIIVPADDDRQDSTQPTEEKPGIVHFFERLFGIEDNTEPTTAPDRGDGSSPATNTSPTTSGRTKPTTKPEDPESDTPSVKPTEGGKPSDPPVETPTEEPPEDATTEPTEGEWVDPTEQSWEKPTEVSWIDPWVLPTEPGEQPKPTDPPKPTQSPYKGSITNTFSEFSYSTITENTVYCRVYGLDGTEYGDDDRYSDQHIASLTLSGKRYTASYSPRDYGILPEDGKYNYEFYTGTGKVLARGSVLLSAS